MTARQMNAAIHHGKSLTAFDAEIKENSRRAKFERSLERESREHAARFERDLAYAKSLNAGFRRVA
jgi:hypothetical protein